MSVYWIIGGGSGVGRATARRLAADGDAVVVSGRRVDALQETADSIGAMAETLVIAGDAGDPLFAEDAIARIIDQYGRLDGLIYAAGIGKYGEVASYALDDWNESFQTNVTGLFLATRTALPFLKESKGAVIGIGSGAALQGYATLSAYAASKFAMRGYLQSLAAEVGDDGVKVSLVLPGSISSGFAGKDASERVSGDGRKYLTPDDVADAIAFLLHQSSTAWTQELNLWPFA